MNHLLTVSIPRLIRERNRPALKEELKGLPGFELAELISNQAEETQIFVFGVLPPDRAAAAFDYLPLKTQNLLLKSLSSDQIAAMLTAMPPDDRTALLEEQPKSVVDAYVKLLPTEERNLTLTLLGYPEGSIGRLMTTDYIAVKPDWTVEQVLDYIRLNGHDSETINVIYVVDDKGVLIDDIRLKEFLFARKEDRVSQIGNGRFISLSLLDKADRAIRVFRRTGRIALPVIDDKEILRGIVTIDDVLLLDTEHNTMHMHRMGGTEALDVPYMDASLPYLIKKRARWLVLLFLGETLTATAMGFFATEIERAIVLALFLPLIISSGGNAGSQSSTLIIRAMALGEVRMRDWLKVFKRELIMGLLLGAILGVIGFARVTLWSTISDIYGPHWLLLGWTVSASLIGVVLWGSLSGSMLPLLLRKVGLDPATASAPLVATLVDVTGIIIYFAAALGILHGALL